MSAKAKIIDLLSGIASFSLTVRKPAHLTVVTYHSIKHHNADYLLDEDVVSTTPEMFEEEVKFFKDYFQIVTFRDVKKYLDHGDNIPSGLLIMTFDDGYEDNYTNVFPVLKKYNVPATIFLSVHHIETGIPYWWNEVVFYLKRMGKKETDIKQFLRELKAVSDKERILRIKDLSQKVFDQSALNHRQAMTWNQIREMHRAGIEFGSHTMNHPILSHVETDLELDFEISESKRVIEERLQDKVIVFSYPVGGKTSYNDRVKQKVSRAGYDFAVTYQHGVNRLNDGCDRFEMTRIDMDKESLKRVKVKVTWPGLFR